jgi:hypothetical protein
LVLSRSRLRLVAAIVPPLQNFFTPPALTIFWPSASTNPREHWVHRLQMTGPSQSGGIAATVTLGHLYVSDFLNDAVEGFSINSSTGALSAVSGSPFPLGGTPPDAGGLTMFVSGGSYLYATNPNAGTVAGFTFDSSNGRLTPVPGSPFPAGNTPVQAVQEGLQSKFLYITDLNDSAGGISAFTIGANPGTLSPIPGSPFPTGTPGSFPGPVGDGDERKQQIPLCRPGWNGQPQ